MRQAVLWVVLGSGLLLSGAGCGRSSGPPDQERFRRDWLAAVNEKDYAKLYTLLDADSRRNISHQIEVLRGLTGPEQRAVIAQLGGTRAEDLSEVSASEYFALLWERATGGRNPSMVTEAAGSENAYMELAIEGVGTQRIRLSIEGGKWVWHLPEQDLEKPTPALPATGEAN